MRDAELSVGTDLSSLHGIQSQIALQVIRGNSIETIEEMKEDDGY